MARRWLFVAAFAAVLATLARGDCMPWTNTGCKIDDHFTVYFGAAQELLDSNNTRILGSQPIYFPFTPQVDQLSAFSLRHLPVQAFDLWMNTTAVRTNETHVYFYGAGTVSTPYAPLIDTDSSTMVLEIGGEGKTCPAGQVAVTDFLVLNLTMTNGIFKWHNAVNPPIQVGFDPTCDKNDACLLGGDSKCIGRPGRRNCAQCVASDALNGHPKVSIFVSYYGTDVNGRAFRSGALNPLRFEQFAFKPVMNLVSDSLSSL